MQARRRREGHRAARPGREARRIARPCSAARAASREPHWVEDEFGRVELATIGTYGDVVHTFVNRADYAGPYLPGLRRAAVGERRGPAASAC